MSDQFSTSMIEATTKLQEAMRDSYALIWNAAVANQEAATALVRSCADQVWAATATPDTGLADDLLANVRKGQEAGAELAQSSVAAGLAAMYFPLAVADQVLRPQRV